MRGSKSDPDQRIRPVDSAVNTPGQIRRDVVLYVEPLQEAREDFLPAERVQTGFHASIERLQRQLESSDSAARRRGIKVRIPRNSSAVSPVVLPI